MAQKNPIAKVIEQARKSDLRRQEQISRQTTIINRLLVENQMMMGLLGELQPTDERAGQILEEIQRLRDQATKQDEKKGRHNGV